MTKLLRTMLVSAIFILPNVSWSGEKKTAVELPVALDDINLIRSNEELAQLVLRGMSGDSEAAFRVALHYRADEVSPQKSNDWMRIAAENGHAVAQYNMWFIFSSKLKDEQAQARSLFWLKKSAAGGFPQAKVKLKIMLERPIHEKY